MGFEVETSRGHTVNWRLKWKSYQILSLIWGWKQQTDYNLPVCIRERLHNLGLFCLQQTEKCQSGWIVHREQIKTAAEVLKWVTTRKWHTWMTRWRGPRHQSAGSCRRALRWRKALPWAPPEWNAPETWTSSSSSETTLFPAAGMCSWSDGHQWMWL